MCSPRTKEQKESPYERVAVHTCESPRYGFVGGANLFKTKVSIHELWRLQKKRRLGHKATMGLPIRRSTQTKKKKTPSQVEVTIDGWHS